MKYLTATGKIIQGDTPAEVFENLKNASPYDAKLTLWSFLEILTLRVHVYYGEKMAIQGMTHLLNQLENVGFLIRVE
ncbi:hypothetical protein [Telluribacter sp.]|jgi:hypothetical protein|uniref:hypothetical protein n=1 Tax=Telluribacter sp. TaxID=1978767 RepID=UPI002E1127F5|nr:hypothetical protein [Telluribacter sp.]